MKVCDNNELETRLPSGIVVRLSEFEKFDWKEEKKKKQREREMEDKFWETNEEIECEIVLYL